MADFDRVSSSDEIIRILKSAATSGAEVYCEGVVTGAPVLVDLDIRSVSGTNVVLGIKRRPGQPGSMLSAGFTNGLKIGDPIEVVFGLVDGQYAIRDVVQDVSLTTFTISAGKNLLRLQRRKDFRVSVKTDGLTFNTKIGMREIAFGLIDLSAGGLRLLWPVEAGTIPPLGAVVKGRLYLGAKNPVTGKLADNAPPEKVVAVELKFVKDHGPDSALKPELGNALSFQFQGLGQEDARAILFTCLFIHRSSYGS